MSDTQEVKAVFDPSRFTITAQAAGGSGSWRLWHYVAGPDEAAEAVSDVGYFNAMAGMIHAYDFVSVVAPNYAAMLVLFKVGPDVVSQVAWHVDAPEDSSNPGRQGTPSDGVMGGPTQTAEFVQAVPPPAAPAEEPAEPVAHDEPEAESDHA